MSEPMGNEDCFFLSDKCKKNIEPGNVRTTYYYGAFAYPYCSVNKTTSSVSAVVELSGTAKYNTKIMSAAQQCCYDNNASNQQDAASSVY